MNNKQFIKHLKKTDPELLKDYLDLVKQVARSKKAIKEGKCITIKTKAELIELLK